MLELNQALFLLLNAPAHPPGWMVDAAAALANSPVAVAPVLVAALWVWGAPSGRGAMIAVAGAVVAAQGVNMAPGLFWFEPRPFMVPVGHTLVAHVADNGFPSDHATLVWTLGAGLAMTGAAPRWGTAVCLYGVAVAWSRIWLGVHFPVDMLASASVGVLMGGCSRVIMPFLSVIIMTYPARKERHNTGKQETVDKGQAIRRRRPRGTLEKAVLSMRDQAIVSWPIAKVPVILSPKNGQELHEN